VGDPPGDSPVRRALDPLWRGLVGYRVLALAYAAGLVLANHGDYRAPLLALAVIAAMVVWTALSTLAYLRPTGRAGRGRIALVDLVVTLAGVFSTLAVETPERIRAGEPILTTVWSAGPALALALEYGAAAGLVAALVVQAAVVLVRGRLGAVELSDLLLIVAATVALGYAARVLRDSVEQLRRATALRAAMAERERLARTIHDGVLQVLARVRRRGGELGGAAAELGELAGEQEVALRTLMATGVAPDRPAGQLDLATTLAELATTRVTVSVPPAAVTLPADTVTEVTAAVRAALDNVAGHAGPDARAWVLVEDRGTSVEVSVRDDGPGIPEGRLAQAQAQGRLGVRQSIVGRIESVGGRAHCESAPGLGCEWVFGLPTPGHKGMHR
jgi:signal transduction histidine kinase